MRPGTGELQFIAFDAIEQQPVRLDVKIPKALPIALKRVILVADRDWLLLN